MGSSISEALNLVIGTLAGLYIFAVLIRFLLQAARADFYNPISQAVVKLTSPLMTPLRKIIPGYRGFDFASLILALIISFIVSCLLIVLDGNSLAIVINNIGNIVAWCFVGLLNFILEIYFWGLLISIIASWIAPYSGNPVLLLIQQLLEPIMRRVHKIIPPMGGLDFSPIFVFLGIQLVEILLIQTLAQSLRLPAQFVIGI
ncbi:MAG: YggT family protein [Gammaproteobacteria bacterium]|nr:YggT family protein [Gammaproteobacteria bacterium]|tara:strand:+ start:471 stop:1076 length:606 start_codon:yes stop_codon:yes gene_type:complete